jgi:hypothetical protein
MKLVSVEVMMSVADHVAVRLREPLIIWGQPGGGKSEGIGQLALMHDATIENGRFCPVMLSQYDSVDLRGTPGTDEEDDLTVWRPPSTLPFKNNKRFAKMTKGKIFLFLDELTSAPHSVAAVAYQLVNDRRVGEHELMDNVVVIAAANRDGDRGVTNRMPTPLANRFTHIELGLDAEVWAQYASSKGVAPEGIAFLLWQKTLLSTFMIPVKDDPNTLTVTTAKNFATPRTWMKAFKYYADPDMPEDVKRIAMEGAVGEAPAAQFWGFIDTWHKVTPLSKILADPEGVPVPEEESLLYATTLSVSGAMDLKTTPALYKFLKRLDPEYTVLAWQLAVKRDKAIYTTKEFIPFSAEYKAIFTK